MESKNEYSGYYLYNCHGCGMSGALKAESLAEAKKEFLERHKEFLLYRKIICPESARFRIHCPNDRIMEF